MSQAAFKKTERETNKVYSLIGSQLAGFVFFLVVICVIIWAIFSVFQWMNDPARLSLSRLAVIGERHYTTDDDIRQTIAALGTLGTFMTQDVNIIQQQIARLPWIKQVVVRKQWPDELKIHIIEYNPVARWNDDQLLDEQGHTFLLPNEKIHNLHFTRLYGPDGNAKEVLDGYTKMMTLLNNQSYHVKIVKMSARRSWQVVLDNDIRLELGRKDIDARIKRFVKVFPILEQQSVERKTKINYIDLRYDNSVAVGWLGDSNNS